MQTARMPLVATALTVLLMPGVAALAQPRALTESECQALRQRLGAHARLSAGVRQLVAARALPGRAAPAVSASAPTAAPGDRAAAIRARLDRIPTERQQLEEQRLGALVKFDFARGAQIQGQISALDGEKTRLEQELAALPAGPAPAPSAPPAGPAPAAPSDAERVRCQDVAATLDDALKTRRRELGVRETQADAVPLVALTGQTVEQIARELRGQLAAWPGAARQVGLLDADGDGRLDGFVDVPAQDVYRLFRQRLDGSVAVEVFALPATATSYGELARRLDETANRQAGRTLVDLLAARPAGPVRTPLETAEFARASAHLLAGNWDDAARASAGAARVVEFQNVRGESVRMLEVIAPTSGGVAHRRVVVLTKPNDQEAWEETATVVRPVSHWRADVEVVVTRETRTTAGALVGARAATTPLRFSVER